MNSNDYVLSSDLRVILKSQNILSEIYYPLNQELFDSIVEELIAAEEPSVERIVEEYEGALWLLCQSHLLLHCHSFLLLSSLVVLP